MTVRLACTIALLATAAAAAGCGVELEHGLDERQANQVAAVLEQAGVGADKVADDNGTFKIVVPRGEAARAFALLEARDLPKRGSKGLAETFADSGLLPSAASERARYAAALAAELERTLEAMPGVTAARVHLALPAEDPLAAPGDAARATPTAAVLLKTRATASVDEQAVRALVAGAVPTLSPAAVHVVAAAAPVDDAPPPLAELGPIRVARSSRATLVAFAASGLGLILILSLLWIRAAAQVAALRQKAQSTPSDAPRK
jgi:type III secretion protein J